MTTIRQIESAVLIGTRPRVVGRNARRGVHGQTARDRVARIHTDDGLNGWGWSNATPDDAKRLVGKRLDEAFHPERGTAAAHLAFDFPLWDLAGRIRGKPVYAMLGDRGTHPVPVYDGSIYIDEIDPDAGRDEGLRPMLDAVRAGWERGFRAFKVKVGRGHQWMEHDAGLKRDIEVIRAIRAQIGGDAELLIDANNGFTTADAFEVLRETADCRLYWIEEPFPENAEDCLALKRRIRENGWGILLADGEGSERNDDAFAEIVRADGIDVTQFDLRAYSLTRWLRFLPTVEETGTLAAPHNWGSHLSGFYIPQMARGCARIAVCETDTMTMSAVDSSGYRLENGVLTLPDSPGWGLQLDETQFRAAQSIDGWTVGDG